MFLTPNMTMCCVVVLESVSNTEFPPSNVKKEKCNSLIKRKYVENKDLFQDNVDLCC